MPESQPLPNQIPVKKESVQIDFMKKMAISAAIHEILNENRAELIRRSREKLEAMGVAFTEAEMREALQAEQTKA